FRVPTAREFLERSLALQPTAPPCADLELSLRPDGRDGYAAEVRFRPTPDGVEAALVGSPPASVRFDPKRLRALEVDPEAYGQLLTDMLFGDLRLREALERARAFTESLGLPLRLRLRLDAAPELHALAWEILLDPRDGRPQGDPAGPAFLCLDERVLLSRYVDSQDLRPVEWPPRDRLSALVAIANPTGL